jgi:hypothetical protein
MHARLGVPERKSREQLLSEGVIEREDGQSMPVIRSPDQGRDGASKPSHPVVEQQGTLELHEPRLAVARRLTQGKGYLRGKRRSRYWGAPPGGSSGRLPRKAPPAPRRKREGVVR